MSRGKLKPASASPAKQAAPGLLAEIRGLIDAARTRTVQLVNAELVQLYWSIGVSIREDLLAKKRASYGQEIVVTLSRQLVAEYGQVSRFTPNGTPEGRLVSVRLAGARA